MTRPHDHDGEQARYGLCLTCADAGADPAAPSPPTQLTLPDPPPGFDCDTNDPTHDHLRLTGQTQRVLDVMADGRWRTLAELAEATGDPEASVSARLRDLRKPKFGGYRIERQRLTAGSHAYRLRRRVDPGR